MNQNLKKALDITTLVGGTAVAGGGILTTYNLIKNKKGIMPIIAGVVTTLVGIASVKYSLDSLRMSVGTAPTNSNLGKSNFSGLEYDIEDEVDNNNPFEPEFSEVPSSIRMDFHNKDFYNPKLGRYMPVGVIKEGTPDSQWELDMPLDVNSSFEGESDFTGEFFELTDDASENNVFEPMSNFNIVNGIDYGKKDFYNPKLGRFSRVGVIKEQSPAKDFDINL